MSQRENPGVKDSSVGDKNFHPIIVQRDGRFCVYLPEWRISGEGQSLEEAYRQYELNKHELEARSAKFELATVTPDPFPTVKKGVILHDLGLFFVKSAFSAFAVILVVVLLLPNIGAAFRHQVRELLPLDPKFWAIQVPSQLNARLDQLKPEEEDQMRNEWNRLLERTAPIWGPLACQPREKPRSVRP